MNRKKLKRRMLAAMAAAGMVVFLPASKSFALDPIAIGDTELSVYGFLRNNTGMFLENQDYTLNGNQLATFRNWWRTNLDYTVSDQFSMFATVQFVYEPEYDIEEGSVSEPDGKEYSEYDNLNDVLREIYVDWEPSSSHSFRLGRQIVIWGESLTTRVGDLVNPLDQRWTFAFANWEDTRIPQYMLKGLHDFSSIASSFEWLVGANVVSDEYRVNRTGEFAIPMAGEMASQRFAIHPEDRFLPPYAVGNDEIHVFPPGAIAGPPLSRGWEEAFPTFWVPGEIANVEPQYPGDGFDDTRFGFRTNTFLDNYEFGVTYLHTQNYETTIKRGEMHPPPGPGAPPVRDYIQVYPDIDYFGVYGNADFPFGVIRAEAIYAPNKTFNTFDMTDFDAITERDYIKYMIAWDINGFLYFDWHKSAPIDITFEHTAEYIPDNDDIQNVIYGEQVESYRPRIGARISTNWFYNLLSTELIVDYGFQGNDGLFMPVVKWTPAWNDKAFSAELRYIGLFGDNDYQDLGMFKQKDMVVMTLQYNF